MRVSVSDLTFAFGNPWQDRYDKDTALEALGEESIEIDHDKKTQLITDGMRIIMARRVDELLKLGSILDR